MVSKRGRKSAADLAVVAAGSPWDRPGPPEDMQGREVDIWRQIVGAMPARWFGRETHHLLQAYCECCVLREGFWRELRTCVEREQRRELIALHRHEADVMARLASKLRISKLRPQKQSQDEVEIRATPRAHMWENYA